MYNRIHYIREVDKWKKNQAKIKAEQNQQERTSQGGNIEMTKTNYGINANNEENTYSVQQPPNFQNDEDESVSDESDSDDGDFSDDTENDDESGAGESDNDDDDFSDDSENDSNSDKDGNLTTTGTTYANNSGSNNNDWNMVFNLI